MSKKSKISCTITKRIQHSKIFQCFNKRLAQLKFKTVAFAMSAFKFGMLHLPFMVSVDLKSYIQQCFHKYFQTPIWKDLYAYILIISMEQKIPPMCTRVVICRPVPCQPWMTDGCCICGVWYKLSPVAASITGEGKNRRITQVLLTTLSGQRETTVSREDTDPKDLSIRISYFSECL